MTSSKEQLVPVERPKPCPFCGKKSEPHSTFLNTIAVTCTECVCSTGMYADDDIGRASALTAWNTRTPPAVEPDEGLVEKVAAAINKISGGLNYDYLDFCRDASRAAISAATPSIRAKALEDAANTGKFQIGDRVKKHGGSWWEGKIVGTYSTEQTPEGYCVQMDHYPNGPVQIYPAAALIALKGEQGV